MMYTLLAASAVLLQEPTFLADQPIEVVHESEPLTAECQTVQETAPSSSCPYKPYLFEVRAEYFHMNSHIMREVFGSSWPSGELLFAHPFYNRYLRMWESIGYTRKGGSSVDLGESTTFNMIFVTLGLRAVYETRYVTPYLGVGPRLYCNWGTNDSDFVPDSFSQATVGGVAEAGFLVHATQSFEIDFFAAYDWARNRYSTSSFPLTVYSNDIQIGGWRAGLGIGGRF